MTREEAVIILDGFKNNPLFNDTHLQAFNMAISALSESNGEWIPVSERLPEEEHEVYCQLSDGSNAVLYVQDNWGQMEWVDGMMGTGTYDVVAWREKPEPYKAESEDKK